MKYFLIILSVFICGGNLFGQKINAKRKQPTDPMVRYCEEIANVYNRNPTNDSIKKLCAYALYSRINKLPSFGLANLINYTEAIDSIDVMLFAMRLMEKKYPEVFSESFDMLPAIRLEMNKYPKKFSKALQITEYKLTKAFDYFYFKWYCFFLFKEKGEIALEQAISKYLDKNNITPENAEFIVFNVAND
jgi:hypothetical protein